MKILISGTSGLIGRNLSKNLKDEGHEITRLVRFLSKSDENTVFIDYENKRFELSEFESFDAVIHLAGENIVGRWTEAKKRKLIKSRIDTTRLLIEIYKNVKNPPKHFLCASAVGIYGNTGDITVDEDSELGSGFLPNLASSWENEANQASDFNARVVNLRIGLVLDKNDGALSKMLTPFKFGLGGNVGDGSQYWSWISIKDVVNSINYILNNISISGPVNLVSPNPCTNKYFTSTLAEVIKRPAIFHIPSKIIKIIFGEMGEQVLLFGTKVKPKKLLEHNYRFIDTDLKQTLEKLIKKS
ncbi:MAG: TIGR01777 family oxidoreductase [Thermodesulfobacteriota bacterium]